MSDHTLMIVLALVATLVMIGLQALYVFHEFAFVVIKPAQQRRLARDPGKIPQLVAKGVRHLDHYIAVDQLGITITSLAVGWIGQPVVSDLFRSGSSNLGFTSGLIPVLSAALAFIVLTSVQMIFGELMPKTVALRHPVRVSHLMAVPVEITARIFHPLVWMLNGLGNASVRLLGFSPQEESHSQVLPAEELSAIIEMSSRHGALYVDPATMRRALNFSDLQARDILVPRQDVVALDGSWPLDRVLEVARSSKYTRFPVYAELIDRVTGLLNLKDLVSLRPDGEVEILPNWQDAIGPIPTLPEHAPIEQVLLRLGEDRQQMALVVDEFGGTAGVLTVADITKWLVGDPAEIVASGDDAYILAGKTSLASVETSLGLSFGEEAPEQDSVGGLIMAVLQRVPEEGDMVTVEGHELEVTAMKGPRVTQVLLRPKQRRSYLVDEDGSDSRGSGQPNE